MFEINENVEINSKNVEGSTVYYADNFYKNPDEVVRLLQTIKPPLWKEGETPSYNGIYFYEYRHFFKREDLGSTYDFIGQICGQNPVNFADIDRNTVITNFSRFNETEFNDYENGYWWPHQDPGYNGIVYLNKDDTQSGTNLYENLCPEEEPPYCPEHYQPWRPKTSFRLVESLEPKYNRLVLFDGFRFPHGMNIVNKDYFGEKFRMNQVFFFMAEDQVIDNPN